MVSQVIQCHINGDTLDNRKSNLRLCTHRDNMCNRRAGGGSSAFKGVSRSEPGWGAQIKSHGQKLWLGTYRDEVSAALVYDAKARELFGEFARTNFPPIDPDELDRIKETSRRKNRRLASESSAKAHAIRRMPEQVGAIQGDDA